MIEFPAIHEALCSSSGTEAGEVQNEGRENTASHPILLLDAKSSYQTWAGRKAFPPNFNRNSFTKQARPRQCSLQPGYSPILHSPSVRTALVSFIPTVLRAALSSGASRKGSEGIPDSHIRPDPPRPGSRAQSPLPKPCWMATQLPSPHFCVSAEQGLSWARRTAW